MNLTNINIPGYEHYLISDTGVVYITITNNFGHIKKLENPIPRKSFPNKNTRYHQVLLIHKDGYHNVKPKLFYIHRLVGQHFISNPNNLPEINHKNFDKNNNDISNLEWVTKKENHKHRGEKDRIQLYKVMNDEQLVQKIVQHYNQNVYIEDIMEYTGLSYYFLNMILKNHNVKKRKNGRPKKGTTKRIKLIDLEIHDKMQ